MTDGLPLSAPAAAIAWTRIVAIASVLALIVLGLAFAVVAEWLRVIE